jgi:hypothetical protein
MSARAQIIFGLTFVALGAGAFFGQLQVAQDSGNGTDAGWLIGAAGFGLPGLLSVGIGIKMGGLSLSAWEGDAPTVKRLASALGLTLGFLGFVVMGIGMYKIMVTTGGECGGPNPPCPEDSTQWFLMLGAGIPLMILAVFLSTFGDGGPAADQDAQDPA